MHSDLQYGGPMHAHLLNTLGNRQEADRRTMQYSSVRTLTKKGMVDTVPIHQVTPDMAEYDPKLKGRRTMIGWASKRYEVSSLRQMVALSVGHALGRDLDSMVANPKQHMPEVGFDPDRRLDPALHINGLDGYNRPREREFMAEYVGRSMPWLIGKGAHIVLDAERPQICYAQFNGYTTGYQYGRWIFYTADFFILLQD